MSCYLVTTTPLSKRSSNTASLTLESLNGSDFISEMKVSKEAKDFVKLLLEPDYHKRLGAKYEFK